MLDSIKYGKIKVHRGDMEYIKFGHGEKVLVMIAGLSIRVGIKGAMYPMAFLGRVFTDDYTVYVLERLINIPDNYSLEYMTEDISQAFDKLGLSKADILGVSQGGMIAQHLALDYPHLVNKLVFAFTTPYASPRLKEIISTSLDLFEHGSRKEILTYLTPLLYCPDFAENHPWLLSLMVQFTNIKDPIRVKRNAMPILDFDLRDRLGQIKSPTFIIAAKKDQLVGYRPALLMQEILQCPMHTYEDVGHLGFLRERDFMDLVYEFLN